MKTKCKYCNKAHKRAKLDVMKAEWIPNAFCSDKCHSAYMIMHQIGRKRTGLIRVEDSSSLEVGKIMKLGSEVVMVESINDNEIGICKYETAN
ncbi:unnamed protein product [marine sediment metagenome]|uniref:Uncharacterized protein n=1 Tax=marine sediment metagenome TaxID=412755 RepID=X0SQY6_9ZZZZ